MEYKRAIKVLNMLKGHMQIGEDARREKSTITFDLAHAQEKLWATLPEGYFDAIECASEIHGLIAPAMEPLARAEEMSKSYDFLFGLVNKMFEKGYTTPQNIADNIDHFCSIICSAGVLDLAGITRSMSHTALYAKTIKNLGTERHEQILLDACAFKNIGCFALTELGHGSNAKAVETTATFDKIRKDFVFNSPTKTSAKFWIGNLGKSATNAVVPAQLLIEEDGILVNKGVHCFEFRIRDKHSHYPYPGLEIGDCGYKKGLNGIDNGYMKFAHFRVPREALLNKFGDVTEDGVYKTDIEDDGKRFASSIMCLSGGRVIVARSSTETTLGALAIAIRYGAVRKQFGLSDDNEIRLLDYPLHQQRLIPRFAEVFIGYIGSNRLVKLWTENTPRMLEAGNLQTDNLHSLSSNMK
jgi:hypothetical protein